MPNKLVFGRYLKWLVDKFNIVDDLDTSNYMALLSHLLDTDFIDSLPNDINRIDDGLALREEFQPVVHNTECSFLEVMIGLSIRMNDICYNPETPDMVGMWFWELIKNLGLDEFMDDVVTENSMIDLDEILWDVNHREYEHNGQGGFFPLAYPEEDQRGVEIWYQMQKWISEGQNE